MENQNLNQELEQRALQAEKRVKKQKKVANWTFVILFLVFILFVIACVLYINKDSELSAKNTELTSSNQLLDFEKLRTSKLDSDLKASAKEVEKLEDFNTDLENENDILSTKLGKTQRKLYSKQKGYKQQEGELKVRESQIRVLEEVNKNNVSKLAEAAETITQEMGKVKKLEAEKAELVNKIAKLEEASKPVYAPQNAAYGVFRFTHRKGPFNAIDYTELFIQKDLVKEEYELLSPWRKKRASKKAGMTPKELQQLLQ